MIPLVGRSSAHRSYYLQAIEYESAIRIFHYMEDQEVIQSFVEGDDPDAYTGLGMLIISKYPRTDFALFHSWVSSKGVSQIGPVFSSSRRRLLSHNELVNLVLTEADSSLNSNDPLWEFEQMQATGFLNLIKNSSAPIRKYHPANIAADLLIIAVFTGAICSIIHLVRQKIMVMAASQSTKCCASCGYSRVGLDSVSRCPECGELFATREIGR